MTKQGQSIFKPANAEEIFSKLFENYKIKKILIRVEKLDIIKNTSSVGIEIEKSKINES